jgi:hypothetical protein
MSFRTKHKNGSMSNTCQTVSQWYKISCICTGIHQLKGLRLLFVSNNKDIAFIKELSDLICSGFFLIIIA